VGGIAMQTPSSAEHSRHRAYAMVACYHRPYELAGSSLVWGSRAKGVAQQARLFIVCM